MIKALYHYKPEVVGSISDALAALELPFEEVKLYVGDPVPLFDDSLSGLIVMGGPMGVDDNKDYPFLVPEADLIKKCIEKGLPVIGICLGSQLIAKALGANVYPNHTKEVGWGTVELTPEGKSDKHMKHSPETMTVLHWHGDTFDLPKGAVRLAQNKDCLNQAYKYGDNVYAFQFHLEVTPAMVKEWALSDQGQQDIKGANANSEVIVNLTDSKHAEMSPVATKIFTSYFQLAYKKKNVATPS